ncbi:hypothetical protein NGRA_2172 [Nosema granulosis]|uniref:Uncharacterized protein n=1 Tax=Nosema granulosis TaxID=83296 RepID=A0A9P6GY52_9MICR|nr:hypothetical protein NGRA_2172 [Nosema granulosis]
MLHYYGITELIGEPGSGKTALAIEESKIYKTLYITSTNFPIKKYDFNKNKYEEVYIEFVQSTAELLFVLNIKLKQIVVELIVIDNLYHIVFLDKKSRLEVTNLIYILKRLIQKYKIRVLVVNTCCFKTIDEHKVSFISKLGLNWEYHVNCKYVCKKMGEGGYTVELVKSPENNNCKQSYRINKTSIEVDRQ